MPKWNPEIRQRLANLKLTPTCETAIAEELVQRLDDCCAELLASGATKAAADRQTLAEMSESEIFEARPDLEMKP